MKKDEEATRLSLGRDGGNGPRCSIGAISLSRQGIPPAAPLVSRALTRQIHGVEAFPSRVQALASSYEEYAEMQFGSTASCHIDVSREKGVHSLNQGRTKLGEGVVALLGCLCAGGVTDKQRGGKVD